MWQIRKKMIIEQMRLMKQIIRMQVMKCAYVATQLTPPSTIQYIDC